MAAGAGGKEKPKEMGAGSAVPQDGRRASDETPQNHAQIFVLVTLTVLPL